MEVVRGQAIDNACLVVVGRVRTGEMHAAHGRVREERVVELHPDNVHPHANPSSVLMAAGGIVLHIHHILVSIPSGTSVEGTAGNEAGGAAADAARPRGAAGRRRTPAAATSSAHRRRGAHGSSRGTRSWRVRPAPAHSPIRPPPSTRRVHPASDVSVKSMVTETVKVSFLYLTFTFFYILISTCYKEIKYD